MKKAPVAMKRKADDVVPGQRLFQVGPEKIGEDRQGDHLLDGLQLKAAAEMKKAMPWPIRFAGTRCRTYSKKAMPQLTRITGDQPARGP
jgi:hypothetical protein